MVTMGGLLMMANMSTVVQQSLTLDGVMEVMEDKRTNLVRAEVQVRQQHFANKNIWLNCTKLQIYQL